MFFLERQRYWTTTALNTSILFDTAHRVHNFILKKDEYTTIIGLQIILFMFIDKHENRKTTIKKFFFAFSQRTIHRFRLSCQSDWISGFSLRIF